MKKDFQKWHKKKEWIHNEKERPFFHEREVWFCSLGVNIGYEQDGSDEEYLRPVIIVKKFNNEIFWELPLTKSSKKGKYYFSFFIDDKTEASTAILSQVRLIDAKRLRYKIGDASKDDLLKIKKHLIKLLQ